MMTHTQEAKFKPGATTWDTEDYSTAAGKANQRVQVCVCVCEGGSWVCVYVVACVCACVCVRMLLATFQSMGKPACKLLLSVGGQATSCAGVPVCPPSCSIWCSAKSTLNKPALLNAPCSSPPALTSPPMRPSSPPRAAIHLKKKETLLPWAILAAPSTTITLGHTTPPAQERLASMVTNAGPGGKAAAAALASGGGGGGAKKGMTPQQRYEAEGHVKWVWLGLFRCAYKEGMVPPGEIG